MRVPELLIPASSLEVLKTAVIFGADAVYIGGEAFGLRAKAKNFSMEDMKEGIQFAHEHNVRVYVTANILAHNGDLPGVEEYFKELKEIGPDALIISDPGVFMIAKRVCPEIEIHISTQANNTNYGTYLFWHELGAKRVVSARELSLKEIKEIRSNIPDDLEIETFVHGAMCISYSGRCLLSNYFTGRDANQGACTHPCRWKYAVMEESRPGEYLPVYENERGTYIFNSKDLCMIGHIPDLIDAGIDSFKIEGRMKTALYVATVARTYRKAIDDYLKDPVLYEKNMPWYLDQISNCTYRQFTTGFFYVKRGPDLRQQHLCERIHLPRHRGRKQCRRPLPHRAEKQIFCGRDHRDHEAKRGQHQGKSSSHRQRGGRGAGECTPSQAGSLYRPRRSDGAVRYSPEKRGRLNKHEKKNFFICCNKTPFEVLF